MHGVRGMRKICPVNALDHLEEGMPLVDTQWCIGAVSALRPVLPARSGSRGGPTRYHRGFRTSTGRY